MVSAKLTKTELEIMNYFWENNKEISARDIRMHFLSKNWSKQTVSTFLKNLVNYGYLKVRKESVTKYYYSFAITREEYDLSPAIDIINNVYSGSIPDFICALVNTKNTSQFQIQQLEKIIYELRSE